MEALSERVDHLVARACSLIDSDDLKDAAKLLREATSLEPGSARIHTALNALRGAEEKHARQHSLIALCDEYEQNGAQSVAHDVIVAASKIMSKEETAFALSRVLQSRGLGSMQDQVVSTLLIPDTGQTCLTALLQQQFADTVNNLIHAGNNSMASLTSILINPKVWQSEGVRDQLERQTFAFLLEQIIGRTVQTSERLMQAIARLLTSDASKLQEVIDKEKFESILTCLDVRSSPALRVQATVAASKFVEVRGPTGLSMLQAFLLSKVASQSEDSRIIAFCAASAMFPFFSNPLATIFMTDEFLSNLVRLSTQSNNGALRRATLNLMSAACIDKTCREALSKECTRFLRGVIRTSDDANDRATAALIMSKIGAGLSQSEEENYDSLVNLFQELLVKPQMDDVWQSSIEGLAYMSNKPNIKEQLANNPSFLNKLIEAMRSAGNGPILFGGLTIFSNLTIHPLRQSADQKRMAQLRAYASASKPNTTADPAESVARVTARNTKVLDSGVVSALVQVAKRDPSPNVLLLISNIMLALTMTTQHIRRVVSQAGAFDTILCLSQLEASEPANTISVVKRQASLSLARCLTSIDPGLLFRHASGSRSLKAAIASIGSLLIPNDNEDVAGSEAGPKDMLPVFEALRALTNIASIDDEARSVIVATCWDPVEDCIWNAGLVRVQQAALECISNLCQSKQAILKFVDTEVVASAVSKPSNGHSDERMSTTAITAADTDTSKLKAGESKRRLQLITALADHEEKGIRAAAGGALVFILEHPGAARTFLSFDNGIKIMSSMANEDDVDMQTRAVCILACLMSHKVAHAVAIRQSKECPGFPERLLYLRKTHARLMPEIAMVCDALK